MTTITENNPHLGSGLPAENWQRGYDGLRFIGYRNSVAYGYYQEGVAARKATTTTENNVAAQAGDEPMRAALNNLVRYTRSAAAGTMIPSTHGNYLNFVDVERIFKIAAQVSPRATADVERDKVLARARAWIVKNRPALTLSRNSTIAEYFALLAAIDAAIATTKPGA